MTTAPLDLLKGLDEGDAAAVRALGSSTTVPAGHVLFRLGAEATALYLVERGRVVLTLPMDLGGREEDLLVEERGPGQIFGWSAVIAPHRFTLNASTPIETTLLAFPREALLACFASKPSVGYIVTRNVATVVGQRLQVFQAMWVREVQRLVESHGAQR